MNPPADPNRDRFGFVSVFGVIGSRPSMGHEFSLRVAVGGRRGGGGLSRILISMLLTYSPGWTEL